MFFGPRFQLAAHHRRISPTNDSTTFALFCPPSVEFFLKLVGLEAASRDFVFLDEVIVRIKEHTLVDQLWSLAVAEVVRPLTKAFCLNEVAGTPQAWKSRCLIVSQLSVVFISNRRISELLKFITRISLVWLLER